MLDETDKEVLKAFGLTIAITGGVPILLFSLFCYIFSNVIYACIIMIFLFIVCIPLIGIFMCCFNNIYPMYINKSEYESV